MASSYDEFDVTGLRTYPLASRSSKVQTADFARPMTPGGAMRDWLQRLPRTLAAADLLRVAESIAAAKERRAGLIWGIGAHVIKTGVSPVLVDLMERGFITALAMNGAGVIHDFEVALAGATSEDVDQTLGPGTFGMAEETGTLLNQAIREAHAGGLGFGQGVSAFVAGLRPRFAELSLLASAHRLGVLRLAGLGMVRFRSRGGVAREVRMGDNRLRHLGVDRPGQRPPLGRRDRGRLAQQPGCWRLGSVRRVGHQHRGRQHLPG